MLSPQPQTEKRNILIIDETRTTVHILSTVLEREGYTVHSASNGAAALQLIETNRPDLILLDSMMPGIDRDTVYKMLKTHHQTATIPVLCLNATASAGDDVENIITKPLDVAAVLAQVKAHLALPAQQHQPEAQDAQHRQEVDERIAALAQTNATLEAEIAECKQTEATLKERIQFETLLTDLSAALVNLSATNAEISIVQGLQHIISFLAIDRCTLVEFSDDKTELFTTHSAISQDIPPQRQERAFSVEFPWLVTKLRHNDIIILSNLPDDLPAEAKKEREYCVHNGIRSAFVIPLTASDVVLGALLFCRFHPKPILPETLVPRLRIVGEILANTLLRKRMEVQLHAHAQHLETLVDNKVRKLEQARAKVIQSAKLASLGEMANGIAHEMNQPLTAILFEAEYLKAVAQQTMNAGENTCFLDAGELYHIGENIVQDIERARRVTDYLRTFNDITKSIGIKTDINDVIRNSFTLTEARLRQHSIDIERRMGAGLPPIQANPRKLEQVFTNLISNAEYALEEMTRRVAAGEVKRDGYRKRLTISTYVENGYVVAEVRDNGCGIPQTIKPHIFEPFFTTKPVGEGNGLGLPACQSYIAETGGQITFESEENNGTTFTLRFPVTI